MAYRKIDYNEYYHVYNRGTLSMDIFKDKNDFNKFLKKLKELCIEYKINIEAYCLMPNHIHLLIQEPKANYSNKHSTIAALMQRLKNSYTKHFTYKYKHSGVVFQGTYNCKHIALDNYYYHLIDYILDNPVRKGLVKKREEWPYSGQNEIKIIK